MKPTIVLARRVAVTPWHLDAKVALAAQREWEPAVLRFIADAGEVTPKHVAEQLLGGRFAVARRLLGICEGLGLVEQSSLGAYVLTEDGAHAAASGEILIPESGTWTLWHSADRMLLSPVIALEPFADLSTSADITRNKRREPMRKFVLLPGGVRDLRGKTVSILHGPHRRVRFDDLRPNGEDASDAYPSLTLELELSITHASARIHGTLARRPIDVGLDQTGPSYDEAWQALLASASVLDRWDEAAGALRVRFDETTDEERKNFTRTLVVRRPSVGTWGTFDDTTVNGVWLAPATPADAEAWATWRLRQAVQRMATRELFATWSRTAVEPFGVPAPTLPDRAALAALTRSNDRPTPTYWRLQAAEDWNL